MIQDLESTTSAILTTLRVPFRRTFSVTTSLWPDPRTSSTWGKSPWGSGSLPAPTSLSLQPLLPTKKENFCSEFLLRKDSLLKKDKNLKSRNSTITITSKINGFTITSIFWAIGVSSLCYSSSISLNVFLLSRNYFF